MLNIILVVVLLIALISKIGRQEIEKGEVEQKCLGLIQLLMMEHRKIDNLTKGRKRVEVGEIERVLLEMEEIYKEIGLK